MTKAEEIIRILLAQRGITGETDINEFLSPRPQAAHDPFLLHGMAAGVDLILSEINAGTRICIYGDYDADGVTSVCVMSLFLKHVTDNFFYYIPSRFTDGYGLNNEALDRIRERGAGLVITVDCGSVSYNEVEHAKKIGLKMVVTDHHNIDQVKADCIVINPKQKECEYPFKGLAGCGVAFKLCQALRMKLDLPRNMLNDCLDLVAIGTIADIVPLLDENRTMVKYGLMKINQRSRMSINTLLEGISLQHVYAENVAYGIAPHINAAGRIGSAGDAVDLFLAEERQVALKMTAVLKERNYTRKSLQEEAFNNCIAKLPPDVKFAVIVRDDIHEGIGGIVAGKIKEQLMRPCVIITPTEDGRLKGTGRSIPTIDLYEFLNEFSELFDSFGGHKGACGFTLQRKNLESLISGINDKIDGLAAADPDIFTVPQVYDMETKASDITVELYDKLMTMEPFGQDNPYPIFKIKNIMSTELRLLGKGEKHLKFTAADEDGCCIECILFNKAQQYMSLLTSGSSLDIIGTVGINEWRGNRTVQFRLEEIEDHECS